MARFTVFNFRENAKASMERLAPGDQVLVDCEPFSTHLLSPCP